MQETRKLKVSYMPHRKPGYVPYLRLGGNWLRQAGIEIGQHVTIEICPGKIVIHTA